MKVLIIEDDENKSNQLISHLRNQHSFILHLAKSYQSGLRELIRYSYDVVILDMSLPNYDITYNESGGRPRPFAGKQIMNEILRKQIITKVIVFTQYDSFPMEDREEILTLEELNTIFQQEFSEIYLGCVYYNASISEWQSKLDSILTRFENRIYVELGGENE